MDEFLNFIERDPAMNVKKLSGPGGIDFNSDKMNLQTRNEGGEIKFKMDPAMLQQLKNAPGFTPVIINIQPLENLPEFLGISENAQQEKIQV